MIKISGIIMFLLGCYGVYWTGKRSFDRTNSAGVQEFTSYIKVVSLGVLEGLIRLVSWASITFGFLFFCFGFGLDPLTK